MSESNEACDCIFDGRREMPVFFFFFHSSEGGRRFKKKKKIGRGKARERESRAVAAKREGSFIRFFLTKSGTGESRISINRSGSTGSSGPVHFMGRNMSDSDRTATDDTASSPTTITVCSRRSMSTRMTYLSAVNRDHESAQHQRRKQNTASFREFGR